MEQKTANIKEKLKKLDKGGLALLRRAAGSMLNEDGKAATLTTFFRLLPPGTPTWAESRYYFAICLQSLWKPEEWGKCVSAAKSGILLGEKERERFEKQAVALLDLRWDEDGYLAAKLCRLAKYCASKSVVWDCDDLLCDLLNWNGSLRKVQQKWARSLCGTEHIRTDENEGEKKDAD